MKICFWGNIAVALNGKVLGGGELQIALLAKALVKLGHEVVVVDHKVSKDFITEDGIKVISIKGYNNGIRILRTLTHRLRLIYTSLKQQEADVYYCRVRDFRHILAFWASRKVKAKFILGLASDIDVMNLRTRLKYLFLNNIGSLWWFFNSILSEIVYSWLLRNSDLVLVQHIGQKNMLLKKNIKSKVFYNLIDLSQIPIVTNPSQQDFCYVGSLDQRKGCAEFYEIMKKSPSSTFKVIGAPRDKTGQKYYGKLKLSNNVTLLGRLNHCETLFQITNSKAMISTSPMEGFPNTFIEAWACGIPVLSLHFDPGNIIEKEKLGIIARGDKALLINALVNIRSTPEFVNRGKAYVERNHVLNDKKLKEINYLFIDLKENKKTNQRLNY